MLFVKILSTTSQSHLMNKAMCHVIMKEWEKKEVRGEGQRIALLVEDSFEPSVLLRCR